MKYKSIELNDERGINIHSGTIPDIEILRLKELRIQDMEEPINVEPHVLSYRLR